MRTRSLSVLAVLGICVFGTGSSLAQAGNEDFRVETWSGGAFEADFRLGLSSGRLGTGARGVVWTARGPAGPGALFSNPALLAVGGGGLVIDGRAGLTNSSFGLGSNSLFPPSEIRTATDDFLSEMGYTAESEPVYTQLSGLTLGQSTELGAVVGAQVVAPGVVVAAGYHRPISGAFGFRMSGLETILDAGRRNGAQTIDIDVLGQFSGASRMSLDIDVLSVGTGIHLGTDDLGSWHFGASLARQTIHAGLDWSLQPELMIVLSGSQQYFYNDADDPNLAPGETNALYWRARGDYSGGGWGGRAGLRFANAGDWLVLSASGNWTQDISLRDPAAFAESYLPAFVNLAGSLDPGRHEDEILDVERLNLAKPNLTEQSSDSLGQAVIFRQPSALTLGLDLGLGPHTLTANYVLYSGELSAEGVYGHRNGEPKVFRVGKMPDYEVRAGLDFRFPDRMRGAGWLLLPIRLAFLDFDGLLFQAMGRTAGYTDPHFHIGGGVVYGDAVVSGVERNVRPDIERFLSGAIPTGLAMARRYTIFDRLDVGVTVAGLPDLLMRTSLTYRFQ